MFDYEKFLYKLHVLIDPAIRFTLIISGLLVSLLMLRLILPKVHVVRSNPFQALSPEEQAEEEERNIILKRIISVYRAANPTSDQIDDRTVLQRFFLFTFGFFVSAYLILGFWSGGFMSHDFRIKNLFQPWLIVSSLIIGTIPYIYLSIRLHRIRVQNSYDLVPAISILLSKYRYYKGNLYYAIYDMCKYDLQGEIKRAFMVLLPALQGSDEITIEKAVEEFYFRIHMDRAIELGLSIIKRVQQGDDIEQSLNFMVMDMSEQKKINAKIKTENREMVQLAYLPIFLIPGILLFNIQLNGFSRVFYYYFMHPIGARYLILTIIVCLVCGLIAYIIQRPRNEV